MNISSDEYIDISLYLSSTFISFHHNKHFTPHENMACKLLQCLSPHDLNTRSYAVVVFYRCCCVKPFVCCVLDFSIHLCERVIQVTVYFKLSYQSKNMNFCTSGFIALPFHKYHSSELRAKWLLLLTSSSGLFCVITLLLVTSFCCGRCSSSRRDLLINYHGKHKVAKFSVGNNHIWSVTYLDRTHGIRITDTFCSLCLPSSCFVWFVQCALLHTSSYYRSPLPYP